MAALAADLGDLQISKYPDGLGFSLDRWVGFEPEPFDRSNGEEYGGSLDFQRFAAAESLNSYRDCQSLVVPNRTSLTSSSTLPFIIELS
jgi:hypothetical protein